MNITIPCIQEDTTSQALQQAAQAFADAIGDARVFAFYGAMGAGKTTFVKALCQELGVGDVVNSPTFAIVNEYHSDVLGTPVFHFDFYRIKRLEEAYDIGIDDYFYSGAPCFVEWPEMVEPLLPGDAVRVDIEELPDGRRLLTLA